MNATRIVGLTSALLLAAAAQAAEITVYKQQNFSGDRLPLRQAAHDLAVVNFHDQISSIVVHSGAWEVCTQPHYRGDCVILKPGSYGALDGRINHRIESMREAPPYVVEAAARAERLAGLEGGAAAELFAAPGFKGPSQPLHRDVHTLVETGFDPRAASLVVREGTWQGCTEPGYQGVCRLFSPGRYRDLEAGGAHIISLRRVQKP